ncbi:midasin [Eublepharis macularius]|uniref:Midasin n=1 Tax=Eublepharis macularius TaxID=481883 RepID=A0AA97J2A5_EUBMA|nr:midasin [Eublepharis macularius]
MENLRLSLAASLQVVAQKNERSSGELSRFLAKQVWNRQDRQCILNALGQLLLDKECTLLISRQFRPILLDLLERNAEVIKSGGQINYDLHERFCVAMSKLIGDHPDVMPFAMRYFKDTFPVFQRLFLESSDTNTVRYGRRRMKLRDLMEAAYKFLQKEQSIFRESWDWSVCVPLLRSHDTLVRWYTASCLALVTCMNYENRLAFLKKIFNSEELIHFRLKLLEESRMQNVECALVLANTDTSFWNKEKELQYTRGEIVSADLSAKVVAVCGVVLPRRNSEPGVNQENILNQFVLVESTCTNLQNLAMAVASQSAVLLEGPVGCGKTSLVEYLAAVTGRIKPPHILKVQLGDQTDSKTLLGMYRCTDVPGEFVWQPGTLTQAVSKGHWILLEDIDYAPLDVISVLIPLLENGELLIPGRSDCIKVAPGFHLFATRRVFSCSGGWYRQQNTHATLLDKYWTKIRLDNMNKAELKEILQRSYPKLSTVMDHLLDIYTKLSGSKHLSENNISGDENMTEDASHLLPETKRPSLEGRELSLRDLLNWCNRVAYGFDSSSPSTALNIFLEALDCFTAMLSRHSSRMRMAEVIGSKLNISKHKAEYYCQLHKPEIVIGEEEVTVGRVQLFRDKTHSLLMQRKKQTFAPTRPSSVLIEQLAVCVDRGEPVLLVGETGTGKTSTVQYLAHITGHHLRVINMNQQSDTADLLGGYKPVDNKVIWLPLRESFEELFAQTFSRIQNQTFLGHIQTCYRQKRWHDLLKLMQHVHKSAVNKEAEENASGSPLKEKWKEFGIRLNHAQQQMKMTENSLVFAFVEGILAQAVKKGEWILLDEINLAAAETLECLSGLLEGLSGSLVLLDRGDTEPLARHPNFRLFACMNPATDIGKRNLPPGIRNRFTELYVQELQNEEDLQILILDYLKSLNVSKNVVQGIISFYLSVRRECETKLVDGTGHRPHYSLRTLCRALRFASSNPCNNIQRSLYEGFCLGFLTQLDRVSYPIVQKLICHYILSGNTKNTLKQPLPEPKGGRMIKIEGYWISAGDKEPTVDETYVLTPSVKLNLRDIVRVVSAGTYPVLIQGDTSIGKTSLIRFLAAASGNHCVRINNHEHTDIQEYIGCYTSDESGKLIFKEGVLIDAMRKGYWVILDELNLAPSDVLEALNRLLDDNRELFITETQETVKAHPRFMLFATQNPPGVYGGRKVLSRAFRNRFVELHFDELPSSELETILHKRCQLPPSYCCKLVKVMLDLQSHRRGSSVFSGKHGFITLRDLFRWAERYRLAEQKEKDYDWLQHLANDGFMLLAGRVRKQEEETVIQAVIEKHFKRKLNPHYLFSEESMMKQMSQFTETASPLMSVMDDQFSHVVWTRSMMRLAVLVGRALEFGEPVLLVGDTGCGKTTICQMFAALANQKLYSVNCHLHMETSDFLGGLRPIRQRSKVKEDLDHPRLFEWHDGALVLAMKENGFFLMDEISLADDSVLERLNSVLETEKMLVLAEKGSENDEVELLTAGKKFRILATMNPGGDFGKKELSPALRNRFTEIWCPQSSHHEDLIQIVKHNIHPELCLVGTNHKGNDIAEVMIDFIEWVTNQEFGRQCILSIRDVLSWVHFMNAMMKDGLSYSSKECQLFSISPVISFVHAACLVYIDGIGSGTMACSADSALLAREKCLKYLCGRLSQVVQLTKGQKKELRIYDLKKKREIVWMENCVGIYPFFIPRGPLYQKKNVSDYALNARTTAMNAQRLLRALQLDKPILLEGSPGVGKTSLVSALAKASGNFLVRINLSEQTDVTDLFGTDLPVEGGKGGEFAWRDGPLLAALKSGHWIVLDELNLASQSVLEGLNACFDHRAEIYIPELGMSFQVQHKTTKIFGCQNPYRQGGGRKGLPKSFLNRLTQVYMDPLSAADMEYIGNTLFPAIGDIFISKMVEFNNKINQEVMIEKKWGHKGSPWEFNLRDLFRWCHVMLLDQSPGTYDPGQHMFLIYSDRMRTEADREKVISVFKDIFGQSANPYMGTRQFHITPYDVQIGFSSLPRANYVPPPGRNLSLLHHSLQPLESIMKCVQMNWLVILVGPAAAGKTSLVQLLAYLSGHKLKIMAMNSSMDTTELLGGFEQVDVIRPWKSFFEKVENVLITLLRENLLHAAIHSNEVEILLRAWSNFILNFKPRSLGQGDQNITELLTKLEELLQLIQRLNNRTHTYSRSEFSSLVEEFRCFKLQVVQFLNSSHHGTFEWVDGMLVEALQSGDWLLMDNVNFCSPSVLDRLNALLEPGGVLTMSERGVIDGVTPTVSPHPNFRLFLSMDPLHGEVSRAMRNRGIEIYIPGDSDENSFDCHDVKLLLHGLGLLGNSICDALVAVHTETNEIIAGSTCSLSSLIHAATLIVQQLHRGISLAKSFYRACWEVYICLQQSQDNRKLVLDLIMKHVSALATSDTKGDSLLALGLWPDSAASASFAAEDSFLAMVQNDAQVLAHCLNRLNLKNSRTLPLTIQDFQKILQCPNPECLKFNGVEIEECWTDDMEVLSASVKLFIQKASSQDWSLRVEWLNQLKKNLPQVPALVHTQLEAGAASLNNLYFSPLFSGISNVIKMLQPHTTDEHVIPMDPRWNMQGFYIRNSVNFDTEVEHSDQLFTLLKSHSNRAILFLDREKKNYIERSVINMKKTRNSALRVSLEFHRDSSNYNSLPHPVVANLAAFFEHWDAYMLNWVKFAQVVVSDEKLHKILHCLLWRDRFWTTSDTVTVDSSGLTLLSLHWHWVVKHLISNIPELLSGFEQHKLSKDIESVAQQIQNSLASPASVSASVKKLQKCLGKPLPFKDKAVVECATHLQKLSKALSVLEMRPAFGDDQKQICTLKTAATEWEIRKALLQAQGLVLRANHLKDINSDELQTFVNLQHSKLKQERVLVESLEEKYAEYPVTKQTDPSLLTQLCSRVQLWPAMEYLALLWQYKLTADCVSKAYMRREDSNQQLSIHSEIRQFIAFCLKFTPATSQQLQGLFYLLDLHMVSSEELSLLWSELVNAALASFWSTTVTTDPEHWLAWRPASEEEKKMPKSLMDCSLKGVGILSRAVFSKCLSEILTSSSKWSQWDVTGLPVLSASNVTLGEWLERAQQLQEVSTVLWNNLAFSSMAEFRFTDSRLQLIILDRQLMALKDLVPVQLRDEYLRNCDKLSSRDPVALQYFFKVLREIAAQDILPEEVLCLWMTCLQQFFGQDGGPQNLPEAVHRGSLWVNLGLLQIHIWLPQTRFDPAVKREYKLKYATEELHRLECEWKTHNLSTRLLTGKDLEDETISRHSHPHIRMLCQRMQKLKNQIGSLGRKQAFRPQSPSYDCLYQEVHQYVSSIAQTSKVQDLLARLLQFLHGDKSQPVQKVLSEEAAWQQSHHQFRKHLTEDYAAFPDVVTPLQAAILQMQHGLRLVASEVHRTTLSSLVCPAKLGTLVASLMSFPSVGGTFPTYLSHADALCSVNSLDVLRSLQRLSQKYSIEGSDREQRMCLTQEQLLVNALLYLRCHALSKGELDHKSLQLFKHLYQVIINEWDEQERLVQEEEEQKNILYKYRTKSHGNGMSEEEEEEREFRKTFPLHEKDFKDITSQANLEEEMETEDGLENKVAFETPPLSHHSLKTIMAVHQQLCLCFARSLWYQQNLSSVQTKYLLNTFISCYQTGASLVAHFYPLIGSEMNDNLQGCQLLASTILQNTLFEEGTSDLALQLEGSYDFYHHPNIQQVQLCQPVLENLTKEVKALLQEWPEHPVLEQLLVVMDRIRSFPVSSPLSKFLNGLEILLAKAQDWEEAASRAVSLRKHLDLVTQLIIQWHKLELNCWSVSLDNTMQRHTEKSMKHWLSIYQIIEKYRQEQTEKKAEEMNLTAVVSMLQAFIEGSTLGEFHTRLQMLLEFHCHVLLMPQVESNDMLGNVLWNLYHYYKQFSECVQATLTELRQPIEKELKEFVKISKWNDVSFWAVKQSVEKAHRTLFKFMKKFEAVLNEPCRSALMETAKDEQIVSLQKQEISENQETKIQSLHNILRKKLATRIDAVQATHLEEFQADVFHPESLQARLPKLTKRMAKICTTLLKNNSFLDLVENLDQFTGDVISSAHELQNMSVNLLANKEKQKSEAKHLLVQKQRALTELFKNLATTGLSYRKGLAWSHSKTSQDLLFLRPLDLRSALALVNCTHKWDTALLSEISSSWDGCQKYFYQSLAHHCRLQTALLAPSKEIGLGMIERCKGFTAHLMKMLVKQRRTLTGLTEQWIILRNLLSCVQEIDAKLIVHNEYDVAFPPQDGIQQWTDRLQYLAMQAVMVLEQLSWLIECCPKGQFINTPRTEMQSASLKCEGTELNPTKVPVSIPKHIPSELQYLTPVASDQLPFGCKMKKQDPQCQQLASRVKNMLVEVKAIKADVDRVRQLSCETLFHSWKSFEVCSSGIESLFHVSTQLQDIESSFVLPETELNQTASQTALIRSLVYIQGEINRSVDDFAIWKTQLFSSISHCDGDQKPDDGFVEHFSGQVELAIHAILSAIQCLVQRRKEREEKETSLEDGVPSTDRLKSGLLTKLLDEDICSDVSSLHAQKIISAISELLEQLKSYGEDYTAYKCKLFNQSCYLLVRLMPVLCKYSSIILVYLTVSLATHRSTGKLLSVLAKIFTELAQKGFCLPKELMEDGAGEGATDFHDYEGGGIGEGEGKKDVSDKVENEVQVEDTYQKGQEKDNEDPESKPDIEGEDNAIEMSEDFEGKTYDGEQEKPEDEKSDEDEELDKQMGNLGDAEADKLDERLWGDEEEEDDESSSEDNITETGPGMDEGNSELVAKDDNLDAGNKNEKPPKDEEKEKDADDGEIEEKIHEQTDEREYDENESDPYHGKQEKQPEIEALELPDDLNLENGEKDEEDKEEEGENPFGIEDKIMDVDEKQVKEEDTEDMEEHGKDPEQMEEDSFEDKAEGDNNMEEETNEKECAEHPNENTREEDDDDATENQKEEEEQKETGIPAGEHGLYPQEEEIADNPDKDVQLPDAAERLEHEMYGQAGEENLQSDTAVELAGTASEKDTVKEEHGSGAADANQSEGHESELMAQMASRKQSKKKTQSFKRKPGQADNERSTGDHSQHVHKRLRMVESNGEAEQKPNQPEQNAEEADAFEHIKQGSDSYDAQTYDVANEEQQKLTMPLSEDNKEPISEDATMEPEAENAEYLNAVETEKLNPEMKMSAVSKSGPAEMELEAQDLNSEDEKECGTDKPLSEVKPDRNKESTIHTAHQFLMTTKIKHIVKNPEELRQELEKQLEILQAGKIDEEKAAAEMWQRYLLLTAALSQQLCEQLRLILEPTQAAKLKGDYRTGKRLNMRKVIPYIASQFRKDKIWLRRTKPSKRQYQICLALDDSASMIDNHSKQLAYESLAVIGNALTLLEVGQIAVCSFGETVQLLHPFHEQFNDQSGTRLLQLCKFEQKKTKIAQFLESATNMFAAAQQLSQNINPETAQLLLIVSDGRGLFLEGKERVTAAVQSVQNANIFVIFVVLDNPSSRDSILDIKVPIFKGPGELPEIRSYIEEFPFPFYIILRDVNALPETLSDALRQWFELVTTSVNL